MSNWPSCEAPQQPAGGGRSFELPVPYFVQPTPITCQSTCLKMMGAYLDEQEGRASGAKRGVCALPIQGIWEELNAPKGEDRRPSKLRNAHLNLKWWLEQRFLPRTRFVYWREPDQRVALAKIVRFIDGGVPVLVRVSHSRVRGHIVLIIGYENYAPALEDLTARLLVHDPYGRFDPGLADPEDPTSFAANAWGDQAGGGRFRLGRSLIGGGEVGPGMRCALPIAALSRRRAGDPNLGWYYLLSGVLA
ncbi:MAG: hypothetical protein IPL40_15315 [Proteobacteria bacterium]|nr:hypothetical protein [Pseudomonadota bacterium]